jgi:WD40 repeat protein
MATGSWDHTARLWNVHDGAPVGKPLVHTGAVTKLVLGPDSRLVLSASRDHTARLWSTADGARVGSARMHDDTVEALAFSPNGRLFATASRDRTARIWKTPSPELGEPRRIQLWAEVVTGMELDQDNVVRLLRVSSWHDRKRQLDEIDAHQGVP